jgi:hypothetical protein
MSKINLDMYPKFRADMLEMADGIGIMVDGIDAIIASDLPIADKESQAAVLVERYTS